MDALDADSLEEDKVQELTWALELCTTIDINIPVIYDWILKMIFCWESQMFRYVMAN